jgi:hypothetical protein
MLKDYLNLHVFFLIKLNSGFRFRFDDDIIPILTKKQALDLT